MTKAADFPPVSDAQWPEQIRDLQDGFAGQLNVYRTMAHHPDLLRAWAPLRQHIVRDTTLGPLRSEVVILRAGARLGSSYEWNQHVYRARQCGMSDDRIKAIGGDTALMEPEDGIVVRAVDELMDHHALTAATKTDLIELVGDKGMFDVIATVGFYSVLGYILLTCDTPLDEDVAASLAAHPPVPLPKRQDA